MSSSLLMKFIFINIAMFVLLRLVAVFCLLTGSMFNLVDIVALPSHWLGALIFPWTIFTYMFSHFGVWHFLFNMLWLYWFGNIFLNFFTPRQLGSLYIMGGLLGAALFLLMFNLFPAFGEAYLIGASAAIFAIVIAVSVYRPNYQINLLFIGGIPIKWLSIVAVFIDFITIVEGNLGGHIAHVGGMLTGLWFALAIKNGHDITSWISRCLDAIVSIFKSWPRKARNPNGGKAAKHRKTKNNKNKTNGTKSKSAASLNEERLDEILGKLKRSGYGALSDEEKEFLFDASRKR